jgi:CDP-diacylglycerol--glycerol-3-phosphate 3-phosphatidyltransferase
MRMAPVLWVIAILANLSVVHRMMYTYREARALEDAQLRSVKEPLEERKTPQA